MRAWTVWKKKRMCCIFYYARTHTHTKFITQSLNAFFHFPWLGNAPQWATKCQHNSSIQIVRVMLQCQRNLFNFTSLLFFCERDTNACTALATFHHNARKWLGFKALKMSKVVKAILEELSRFCILDRVNNEHKHKQPSKTSHFSFSKENK